MSEMKPHGLSSTDAQMVKIALKCGRKTPISAAKEKESTALACCGAASRPIKAQPLPHVRTTATTAGPGIEAL
jgi:hypothetical protein